MAEITTLARPYARAAFEYARSSGQLAQWDRSLALLAAVTRDAKVEKLLASPALTAKQKSEVLVDICGDQLNDKLSNFLHILAENKRLEMLPEIQALFAELKAQLEKSIDVSVSTAFEIPAELKDKLTRALSTKLQREVSLTTEVDPSLLGGALIRAGDTVIDGSVRGRLAKLAEAMNS